MYLIYHKSPETCGCRVGSSGQFVSMVRAIMSYLTEVCDLVFRYIPVGNFSEVLLEIKGD
jgi:hypothetical protein